MFDPSAWTFPLQHNDVPLHLQLGRKERKVLRAALALAEGDTDALVLVSELACRTGLEEQEVLTLIPLLEVLGFVEYTSAGGVFATVQGFAWGQRGDAAVERAQSMEAVLDAVS